MCKKNKDLTHYLLQIKPPNYLCATFFDWIKPFAVAYMEDSNKYIHSIISPSMHLQMGKDILEFLLQVR